jgi:hypothetical protein
MAKPVELTLLELFSGLCMISVRSCVRRKMTDWCKVITIFRSEPANESPASLNLMNMQLRTRDTTTLYQKEWLNNSITGIKAVQFMEGMGSDFLAYEVNHFILSFNTRMLSGGKTCSCMAVCRLLTLPRRLCWIGTDQFEINWLLEAAFQFCPHCNPKT